ncbi:MAG: hypothetical protein V4670_06080 [Bacteroidota bacterium]
MKRIITIITMLLFATSMLAQAPQKMSYQAIVRNGSDVLVANATVGMRISVLQGTANGTAVYVETQNATTNANGLVTLEIGGGTVVSGTFASISWGTDAYFIKTETDPTGGSNYTIVGTSQFLSVPYALYAGNSSPSANYWTATGTNMANNNTGNVGIGTGATVPSSLLTVKKDGIGFTQEDSSGNKKVGFYTNSNGAWIQTHSNTDLLFSTNDGPTQMTLQNGTGNLGIGVDAPNEKLVVAGKTKTVDIQVTNGAEIGKVLTSDALGNATWQTATNSWTTTGNNISNNNTGNVGIGVTPTEKLEVAGKTKTTNLQVTTGAGIGKVLTSDAVGNATWQTSSSSNTGVLISKFGAQIVPNNIYTKVLFNQENHDPSNAFNNSTGEWTIPSTGFYHMNATVTFDSITASASGSLEIDIYKNGAALKKRFYPINIGAISIALDAPLVAGDIISVYVAQGTGSDKQINVQSVYSYFSGYRIY